MLDTRKIVLSLICMLTSFVSVYADTEIDSLLKVLDRTIADRKEYTAVKEHKIEDMKKRLQMESDLEKRYRIQQRIITAYQSFKCDSALFYIDRNMEIARSLNNTIYLDETKLNLTFVFSLSGLFTQALDVFDSIRYETLPNHLKAMYCWNYIRYYENLIKYTDNAQYEKMYVAENRRYRDTLMTFLGKETDMYLKEKSFKLQQDGAYEASAKIQSELFDHDTPDTHEYAMAAMGLSKIYGQLKNTALEEKYLLLAAITDVRLAVKENESLLTLAIYLHQKAM